VNDGRSVRRRRAAMSHKKGYLDDSEVDTQEGERA